MRVAGWLASDCKVQHSSCFCHLPQVHERSIESDLLLLLLRGLLESGEEAAHCSHGGLSMFTAAPWHAVAEGPAGVG